MAPLVDGVVVVVSDALLPPLMGVAVVPASCLVSLMR